MGDFKCIKGVFGKVKTPALEQLEKQFQEAGGEWKNVKLTDLFIFKRGTRLVKKDRIEGKYPLVTAGENNLGVKCFIGNKTQEVFSNAITIDMFCNSFVHIGDFCCDDNILVLTAKSKMSKSCMLYISSIINRYKAKWGYEKQYRMESLKKHSISIPFISDAIAFDYIESYIKELEDCGTDAYKKYLQELGFGEYQSTQDKNVSVVFEEICQWKEFKLRDLFYVRSNPQLNKESFIFREKGEYPYFTRTCLNNGINGYVEYFDEEHKIQGNALAVGMLGMQFFYIQKDFYAGQFTKTIYPRNFTLNPRLALYFTTLLNKHSQSLLGVLVRDFEKTFLEIKIKLPLDSKGKIDFEYMENMIKALQRQSLARVSAYFDEKI